MGEKVDLPPADSWSGTFSKTIKLSHKWTIQNFSFYCRKSPGEFLESRTFCSKGNEKLKWCLRVYPSNVVNGANDYVAIYLHLLSPSKRCDETEVTVKYNLCIVADNDLCEQSMVVTEKFTSGSSSGFVKCIRKSLLQNTENIESPDDTLTIFCEMAILQDIVSRSGKGEPFRFEGLESRMVADMAILLENETCSDVTITVGGKDIRAHKAILAARSPVFSAMFQHDMSEQRTNRVRINDIEHEVFLEMLTYIYTDVSPNLARMANKLLPPADKYGLERLKAMCCDSLYKRLNKQNAVDTLILAYLHSADQLKSLIVRFIRRHKENLIKTERFLQMSSEHPVLAIEILYVLSIEEESRLLKKSGATTSVAK